MHEKIYDPDDVLVTEVQADIECWLENAGDPIGLATVVETWGSAPRKVGAKMAFTAGGRLSGSVSGGCVEAAVIEAGKEVLQTSLPQLLEFGVADDVAWSVGLACGGHIVVFVEPLDLVAHRFARELILARATGAIVTVLSGPPELVGQKLLRWPDGLVDSSLPPAIVQQVTPLLSSVVASRRLHTDAGLDLFVDVLRPPPTLIVVGGAHIAVALTRLARIIGYATIVVDPRRAFGSDERFPDVDRLIQAWPAEALAGLDLGQETAVVTLSHDPKVDDPALVAALGGAAFYVGALGSRRTHAARMERLAKGGMPASGLASIHAPVGLDIGADNPEEIALAIMAEVVAAYRQREK